jgi:hypothetical protein
MHIASQMSGRQEGAQQLGQALPVMVWVPLALLVVVWMPQGCRMLERGIQKVLVPSQRLWGGGWVLLLLGGHPSSLCFFTPYPLDGPLTPSSSLSEPPVAAIVC